MKMRLNQQVEENKPALKFNFTQEHMHPDMILFNIWGHPNIGIFKRVPEIVVVLPSLNSKIFGFGHWLLN